MDIKGDRRMEGRIRKIICNWDEFDLHELDKKYNLIDFGEDEKYPGYKWFLHLSLFLSLRSGKRY